MTRSITRRQLLASSAGVSSLALLSGCPPPAVKPTPKPSAPPKPALQTGLDPYFEKQLGITPELIRKVLSAALEHGGDFADVYFQHASRMTIGLEDNIVNKASTGVDLGVGIRVVVGDQTGYAFTEEVDEASMIAAAKTAAGIASASAKTAPVSLTPKGHPRHYDIDYNWFDVGVDRVIPMVAAINDKTHKTDPRIQRVTVDFLSSQSRVLVADSEGRVSSDNRPMTRLFLSVVMSDKGQLQSNGYNLAARQGIEFYTPERLDRLVRRAVNRTSVLFEAKRPPGGELPVVLAAGSSGILLHEAIGHGMEADFNRKKTSIFSDRIGKQVAQRFVSIIDDGTNAGLRGSLNVDDEGRGTERTYLVKDGILRSYLHDRISATHYKVAPTGSGRRQSFRHAPMPRMRNTYMLNGPHKKDEIIASVKKGIYCVSFTNGQVNIGAGDYSFYVKNGTMIEDGKLTAPIKDINIIGNGPQSLERVTMVADDFEMDEGGWTCGKNGQSVPVSLGLPTILVSAITVGGKA
ncbi:MAG: TldD/PmbA family protein [Deltaproteobacteria bacterium]|nr:MAG: TldD/PmbA family protein [Deltaproteobacteria bacterium]